MAQTFRELILQLEDLSETNTRGERASATPRLKRKVVRGDYSLTTTQGPLIVHSWKFPEFELTPEKNNLPCYARGLFTSAQGIVARGYDKFFNIGEFPSVTIPRLRAECTGPFHASTKENGCIIFFSGLPDNTLVVCSKNVTGDYVQDATKMSHYMRGYEEIQRQLARIGKTTAEFAQELYENSFTAVAELCDDEFEEHVLEYSPEIAGLYLHGLNKNTIRLETASPEQVSAFGTKWGFRNVDQLRFDTFDSLMAHLNETAQSGMFNGREIEGFVVRCKRNNHDFFFKYKFEQPYFLYRQWREATNKVFSERSATKTIREVVSSLPQHQRITLAYLLFVQEYFAKNPEAQQDYDRNHGVIKMRKLFLRHLGLGDFDGTKALALDGSTTLAEKLDALVQDSRTVYCVVTMAAPACGKSTVCRTLAALNEEWVHLENDNFSKGNLFVNEILSTLDSKSVCFVDRMNYRERYRADLFRKLHENRNSCLSPDVEVKFIGINFIGRGISENTKNILEKRLISRGDNHQSVQASSNPKQAISLMNSVCDGYQAPVLKDDDGEFRRVVSGDQLTRSDSNFAFVINLEVDEMESSLQNAQIVYHELVNAYKELEIKDLSAEVWNHAYSKALAYKPKTRKKVAPEPRKVEYYGVSINKSEVVQQLQHLLASDLTWQKLQSEGRVQEQLHVTLAHSFSAKDAAKKPKWDELGRIFQKNGVRKLAQRNESVPVDIFCQVSIHRIVVVQDVLVTLEVSIDEYSEKVQDKWIDRKGSLPHTNEHLHITIGTVSPQIKPMMSNVYLEHLHATGASDSVKAVDWEYQLEAQQAFIRFN